MGHSTRCRWSALRLRNQDVSRRPRTRNRKISEIIIHYMRRRLHISPYAHRPPIMHSSNFHSFSFRAPSGTRIPFRWVDADALSASNLGGLSGGSGLTKSEWLTSYNRLCSKFDASSLCSPRRHGNRHEHDVYHGIWSQGLPVLVIRWKRVSDSGLSHRRDGFHWRAHRRFCTKGTQQDRSSWVTFFYSLNFSLPVLVPS
jgi:hypothetical protein